MTDREKLADLICSHTNDYCSGHCNLSSASKCYDCVLFADYLIANGVTFANDKDDGDKWISVTERLPEDSGKYLAVVPSNVLSANRIVLSLWYTYKGGGESDWQMLCCGSKI